MNRDRVILFCGHTWNDHDDKSRWFSILAPEIPSAPSSSSSGKGKKRNRISGTPIKSSLSPFSVMKLPRQSFFTAVGSCVYVFHHVGNRILMLSIVGDDSKLSPPMIRRRRSFQIVTLDSKLYVIGGFSCSSFMECFDPNTGTWEILPQPPFMIQPPEMVTGILEDRKGILFASYPFPFSCAYNVNDRTWSNLKPAVPVPNLQIGDSFLRRELYKSVVVGNMLYCVSFDNPDRPKHLVIQAFDLHLDQWFEACLNVAREIFGDDEDDELLVGDYPSSGLIHLCDQKFCLLLQSLHFHLDREDGDYYDRRRSAYFIHSSTPDSPCLYSVVLEVSTILDRPKDLNGFMMLNIDVLSTEKYLLSETLEIQHAMLVDNAFHPSNMLAFRCNESMLKEFGMDQRLVHELGIWGGPTPYGGTPPTAPLYQAAPFLLSQGGN